MTVKVTQTLLILLGTFCLLGSIGNQHGLLLVAGQEADCDISPNAMINAFGKDIPQTCVNVPHDFGIWSSKKTIKRCFYTYLPEKCNNATDAANDLPLVFDIHGIKSCPLYSALYTGWMEKAEEECFVVVWPIGNTDDNLLEKPCWNVPGYLKDNDYGAIEGTSGVVTTSPCCCFDETEEAVKNDDPLFLRIAIDAVIKSFDENDNSNVSIDRSRVYMAGHSNGCIASIAMAALHSDVVAAVCCHAGTVITPFPSDYSPVPIWMAFGMKDEDVPAEGSIYADLGLLGLYGLWSVHDTMNYIASRNNCEEELDEPLNLGENVTSYKRTKCTNNANVEMVALFESGHMPYSPVPNSMFSSFAETTVDTTALAWNFCSSYSNPRAQESIAASQDQVSFAEVDKEVVMDPITAGGKEPEDLEVDEEPTASQDQGSSASQDQGSSASKDQESSDSEDVGEEENSEEEPEDPESDKERVTDPSASSASRSRLMHESGSIQGTIAVGIGIGIVLTSSFV